MLQKLHCVSAYPSFFRACLQKCGVFCSFSSYSRSLSFNRCTQKSLETPQKHPERLRTQRTRTQSSFFLSFFTLIQSLINCVLRQGSRDLNSVWRSNAAIVCWERRKKLWKIVWSKVQLLVWFVKIHSFNVFVVALFHWLGTNQSVEDQTTATFADQKRQWRTFYWKCDILTG